MSPFYVACRRRKLYCTKQGREFNSDANLQKMCSLVNLKFLKSTYIWWGMTWGMKNDPGVRQSHYRIIFSKKSAWRERVENWATNLHLFRINPFDVEQTSCWLLDDWKCAVCKYDTQYLPNAWVLRFFLSHFLPIFKSRYIS